MTRTLFSFVARRLLEAVVAIFAISTLTFFLLRCLPGGPFDAERVLPPEVQAHVEAYYGLNQPVLSQYFKYISHLLQGDFGESYKYIGRPVTDIIFSAFPASFELGLYSLIFSIILGIPLGLTAAANHNRWWDHLLMITAVSGVSMPSFFVAPILIVIFCFQLEWLPAAFWEGPSYYILPVFALGVRPAAAIARLTRASVLDVIRSDFVRTAKAKGLNSTTILFKHVLRNSLIPVLAYMGPLAAGILTGSFVIELIFAINGMAKHFVYSVTNRDYPLVLGMTIVFSSILILANLIVDLLYVWVDPRIKLNG